MKVFVLKTMLLVTSLAVTSAWDPDAGVVKSLTKMAGVSVFASSHNDTADKANDGDDNTQWTSRGCLPGGFFLDDPLTNVAYRACQQGRCSATSTDSNLLNGVTNSDSAHGSVTVKPPSGGGNAQFVLTLEPRNSGLRHIVMKGAFHAPTQLIAVDGSNEKVVATLTSADNYQTKDYNVTFTPATALTLRSAADFTLNNLGAVGKAGCVERLAVDLGAPRQVRVIRTRHWAGQHGVTSQLVASQDGVTWETLRELDPDALHAVVTDLGTTRTLRYVGVKHTQDESDYAKVYVWEIDAYGDNGVYGEAPTPKPNSATLREMLGVNAIWGWGWGKDSNSLSKGQGAAVYAPVASYARSYHNLNWDVKDPDNDPGYDGMAQGHGTDGEPWLNWDREYELWQQANVSVHVSVQFTAKSFPVSVWDHPRDAALRYGQAFANHFGPTHGNGLVRSMEVGNEPWDYPADFYRTVLDGMASGVKGVDPSIKVMAGAFQAHDPGSTGNYIGTRVTEALANKVDVINSHHYSWRTHSDGSRHATFPEDPAGSFNEVRSIVRWRNTNTPAKPLWMTEWGWDSPGGGQQCSKFPECTSEQAASAYAARGLLLHARLDVERSTWFFYGNLDDCDDHVFCRSGLTSSKSAQFVKKGPYYTLQHLLDLLGHTHFLGIVQEHPTAYVYLFGDVSSNTPSPTHIVAWRPQDGEGSEGNREVSVTFSCDLQPAHAWRLSMTAQSSKETSLPSVHNGQWSMTVAAMPTVVQLGKSGHPIGRK